MWHYPLLPGTLREQGPCPVHPHSAAADWDLLEGIADSQGPHRQSGAGYTAQLGGTPGLEEGPV